MIIRKMIKTAASSSRVPTMLLVFIIISSLSSFGFVNSQRSRGGNPSGADGGGRQNGGDACITEQEYVERLLGNRDLYRKPTDQTNVSAEIWLQDIEGFTPDGSLKVILYLSYDWYDNRYRFDPETICGKPKNVSIGARLLTTEEGKKLWNPDIGYITDKNTELMTSPFTNQYIMIHSDGKVWYNMRNKIEFNCKRRSPHLYPHDSVTCSIQPQSWSYRKGDLDLHWKTGDPVHPISNIYLPQWNLTSIESSRKEISYPAGLWVELKTEINLSRRQGYFWFQFYVPSIMIVLTAWLSFFLKPKSVTPRVILCVQAFFFLFVLGYKVSADFPQFSFVTSFDTWLGSCYLFVFVALVVTVISNRCSVFGLRCRRGCGGGGGGKDGKSSSSSYNVNNRRQSNGVDGRKILTEDSDLEDLEPGSSSSVNGTGCRCLCISTTLDALAAIALPVLFAVYTMFYFSILS